MSLVRLNIKGISYSQTQNGAYALILSEENGDRKLPIVIGAFEAQSIAIALEKEIMPPRPLTHDLFKTFATRYEIVVKQVIIHKLLDGVFYSSIICEREKIEEIIDARTSDAIALALDIKWHEAFYMAQRLFKFPKEFEFPSSKGKEKEIKLEKKFQKDSWVSELQINRKENRFTKIEYHYKNKGFSKVISIYKESGQLVISNTEEIK